VRPSSPSAAGFPAALLRKIGQARKFVQNRFSRLRVRPEIRLVSLALGRLSCFSRFRKLSKRILPWALLLVGFASLSAGGKVANGGSLR